jgi:tagatose-6-phosphate ketose/aldose isomerase
MRAQWTSSNEITAVNSEYLGFSASALEARSAIWTAREIVQQPTVWRLTAALVQSQRPALQAFLEPLLARDELRIVFIGAGTSAFIGECLAPMLGKHLDRRIEAVATTDIVSGPQHYLYKDTPTLLVSFARSGNSPESVASIDLAEQCIAQCWHLVITCNQAGAINKRAQAMSNALVVTLPDETHDRSFAMTSSFSSMLLSAALVFGLFPSTAERLSALCSNGERTLNQSLTLAKKLVTMDFSRIIYLGSNGLQSAARESALKLLELTDGRVMGLHDSSLGFRHGPKTGVNAQTLIVVYCSSDAYTRQYDLDLLRELCRDNKAAAIVAVSTAPVSIDGLAHNLVIADTVAQVESDVEGALLGVMFAQVNALLHSLKLGVTPDNPSPSGLVNRVVKGVTLYPYSSVRT